VRRAACILAAIIGCHGAAPAPTAPATPARSPSHTSSPARTSLSELLRADIASDRAFPWSLSRRLAWHDFQGTPRADGPQAAMTAYTMYYAWHCRRDSVEFLVVAGFRPRASWVKAVVLKDTAQNRSVLAHEQTHFDLTEVHARAMRRHFAALDAPCRKTNAQLDAIARGFLQDEKAAQRRYDEETNHGRREGPQARWTETVRRSLSMLPR
jgi:hypothetical protein